MGVLKRLATRNRGLKVNSCRVPVAKSSLRPLRCTGCSVSLPDVMIRYVGSCDPFPKASLPVDMLTCWEPQIRTSG
jgi:hypothetical protein